MGACWLGTPEWSWVERAEELLDEPISSELLVDEPSSSTVAVQLSVFLTSWMAWCAASRNGALPTVFAGHSLGQMTALTAAGVLSFDDAVRAVSLRGVVTERACRAQEGGMLAVLGLARRRVSWATSAAPGRCWTANDNAPGQTVISGTRAGVDAVAARARELGATKLLPLAVDGPFHTPLMVAAAHAFGAGLSDAGLRFRRPTRPVVSNVDLRRLGPGERWIPLLTEHLLLPVRWVDTQQAFVADGVEQIVEFGHGTTLTSLARRTVPDVKRVNVDGPLVAAELAGRTAGAPTATTSDPTTSDPTTGALV